MIQSSLFRAATTRVVAPLVLAGPEDPWHYGPRLPRFTVEGRTVTIDPLLIQAVPVQRLGPPIASLADDESAAAITAALDALLSRAYG